MTSHPRWPLRRVRVTGPSMVPALRHGDIALVLFRHRGRPTPGTVVVVDLPDRPTAVKRLVRLEPDGRVWVEGDNAEASTDSRQLGALAPESVRGRVFARIWPHPRYFPRVSGGTRDGPIGPYR